ncbi:MAG TPA: 4Fe-4S binding protein [Spirochaetota bacterium]|nr:4Fe-4S binding protein [Spirochaetota bacterium]
MNLFRMAKTVTKSLFTGPATLMYPARERVYAEIARGHIEIEINICIFCGMCSRKCPTDAITVTKENRQWTIDRLNCTACGRCVEVCPVKCLHMNNRYSAAVTDRKAAIFTAAAAPGADKSAPPDPGHPAE